MNDAFKMPHLSIKVYFKTKGVFNTKRKTEISISFHTITLLFNIKMEVTNHESQRMI